MTKSIALILVSGGSGLVGSYLLRALVKKGEKVRAIYRTEKSIQKTKQIFSAFGEEMNFNAIEWVQADLLDLPSLEQCFKDVQLVYHCAAVVSFQKREGKKMIENNVEGTANMVNLSLDYSIEKFCFVSSVAALGKYRDNSCADENTLWQKEPHTSDYSISKFYSENEVWRAAEEGLNMVIVNPSTIIGFGDWTQSSNALFKRIDEGLPFYPPGSTGFIAVEDVVESMIRLMESSISNERFVISAENLRYQQLFEWIAKSLGKKTPSHLLKKWQAKLYVYWMIFQSLFTQKPPKISNANIQSSFSTRCFKSEKIKTAIQFEFQSIEEAIDRSGKLYQKYY